MKKFTIPLYAIVIFFMILSIPMKAQQNNADKQIIATLEEGESFVYGESCFTFTADRTSAYFITKKDGKFFIYDNGTRKGPFDEVKDDMLKSCKTNVNPLCAVLNTADCLNEEAYTKYVTSDANNSMYIKVNGKTFGPYMAVMQFAITCDKSKFVALIMNADQSIHFIHSSGKDLPINGLPQWLLLSPDGEQAIAAFGKTIDPSKIDMSNFNMADFTSFQVIDLNGNISGPYTAEQSVNGSFWFCKTGGPHWFLTKDGQILRDGKPFRKEIEGYGSCDIWINSYGTQIGLVDYGQGTVKESADLWLIKNPIEITTYQSGGKTWIKWISLENGNSIVSYKRAF